MGVGFSMQALSPSGATEHGLFDMQASLPLLLAAPAKRFSVIRILSHPFRPVFRPHAAGSGPAVGCVELAVPLQRPQFLKSNLSHRPVHKKPVYPAVMSVDAERRHTVPGAAYSTLIWRWGIGVTWRRYRRNTIKQHRYFISILLINAFPLPLHRLR